MGSEATELAWAAGFFDGEGYVSISFSKGTRWPSIVLGITQHNRETLERFSAAVGRGKIYGPRRSGKGELVRYDLHVGGIDGVTAVLLALSPYLSSPKRNQAEAAVRAWAAAREGPEVEVTCEECGQTATRRLDRGLQPNLRYCSKACRRKVLNRRDRDRQRRREPA